MLLGQLVLLALALIAARRLLERAFPAAENWVERTIALTALAVHPAVLANTLQPNADLGVLAGSILFMEALASRVAWQILAAGFFLAFSKEVGVLALVSILGLFAIRILVSPQSKGPSKRAALRAVAPGVVPLLVFGIYLLGRFFDGVPILQAPPSHSSETSDVVSQLLSSIAPDATFRSYAAGILVMQFQWLVTLPLAIWSLRALWRTGAKLLGRAPDAQRNDGEASTTALLVLVACALFFLTTRYRTYSSPRYWVCTYPAMLLAAYAVLRDDLLGVAARKAYWAALAGAWLFSLHATIDPVSRALYGTFRIGTHSMLRASSLTDYGPEKVTGGRDALVYNLQFANFHYLQNAVLAQVGSPPPMALVTKQTEWHLWDQVDSEGRRTLDRSQPVVPLLLVRRSAGGLEMLSPMNVAGSPTVLVYVVYPMFEETQRELLKSLSGMFQIAAREVIEHDGYAVDLLVLRARERGLKAPGESGGSPNP
jgi:hypothetical protein